MGIAAGAGVALAQSQLPLHSSGLEHVGYTAPDAQKSAAFFGRIFDPQIFQEMMPPYRYYCRVGIGYLAFGPANNGVATMDHFCATIEDYRLEDMRAELKAQGIALNGAPGYNALTDPDGIRMQFMATPGGLLQTIIPSTRVTQDDAVCQAIGLDHIVLSVPDVDKSAQFYSKFYGQPSRSGGRAWFRIAKTQLGLQKGEAGKKAGIDHVSVRVAAYDKNRITERLKKIGVEILPSTDEKLLRFKDYNGFPFELRGDV